MEVEVHPPPPPYTLKVDYARRSRATFRSILPLRQTSTATRTTAPLAGGPRGISEAG
jgi:hypothetical protein